MLTLRPYQKAAENGVFNLWTSGSRSVIGRCFTGGGKTLIFSSAIQRIKKPALVIAHREELIWQARNKIEQVTGLKFQVEMGDYRAINRNFSEDLFNPNNDGDAGVVATVQTLTAGGDGKGRMTKWLPKDFGLLIVDEAHHATSASYRKIIEYFLRNPELVVLAVTATPKRSDEEALGQVFDDVAFDFDMNYGVTEGWLAPIDSQCVHVESLDFSKIKMTCGDLNQGQLSSVMELEKPLHGIAYSTIEIAGDKRGIGFSPSVEHARKMADIFNRHKAGSAAFICGKTDKEERKKINADFANGCIRWIWNCGTHTEGFDDAGVEVIVPKPTKSASLLEQMIGRGTRPHDSIAHRLGNIESASMRRALIARSPKPTCLILEHYGNRYDLATTFDILGGKVTDKAVKEAVAMARKSGNRVPVLKSIEEEEKRLEEKKKREAEEAAKKANLVVGASYKTQKFNPFDVLNIKAAEPRGWDAKKQLSDKMKGLLRKAGINPDSMSYAQGKQMCGVLIDRWNKNLCSIGQAKLLKKYGYSSEMTFEEATRTITAIKNNGWKKPDYIPITIDKEPEPF